MIDAYLHMDGRKFKIDSLKCAGEMDILLVHALDDINDRMTVAAKTNAGFKSGNLKMRGIESQRARPSGANRFRASTNLKSRPIAGIVSHEGSGIFGPKRTPITARPGHVLRFNVGGVTIFRHAVRGQRPNRFMQRAFIEVDGTYVSARVKKLAAEIVG